MISLISVLKEALDTAASEPGAASAVPLDSPKAPSAQSTSGSFPKANSFNPPGPRQNFTSSPYAVMAPPTKQQQESAGTNNWGEATPKHLGSINVRGSVRNMEPSRRFDLRSTEDPNAQRTDTALPADVVRDTGLQSDIKDLADYANSQGVDVDSPYFQQYQMGMDALRGGGSYNRSTPVELIGGYASGRPIVQDAMRGGLGALRGVADDAIESGFPGMMPGVAARMYDMARQYSPNPTQSPLRQLGHFANEFNPWSGGILPKDGPPQKNLQYPQPPTPSGGLPMAENKPAQPTMAELFARAAARSYDNYRPNGRAPLFSGYGRVPTDENYSSRELEQPWPDGRMHPNGLTATYE